MILGAGDYAAALCRAAAVAGFAVTVCDGWGLLVTAERFPDADKLVIRLPHEYLRDSGDTLDPRTAICVLTHDERSDVPALREALRCRSRSSARWAPDALSRAAPSCCGNRG